MNLCKIWKRKLFRYCQNYYTEHNYHSNRTDPKLVALSEIKQNKKNNDFLLMGHGYSLNARHYLTAAPPRSRIEFVFCVKIYGEMYKIKLFYYFLIFLILKNKNCKHGIHNWNSCFK